MKKAILVIGLYLANNAMAAVIKSPCTFKDFQQLHSAVGDPSLVMTESTAGLGAELLAVLEQEMGPTCQLVTDTDITVGIPEETRYSYEIDSNVKIYNVVLVWNKIERKFTALFVSAQ